MDIAITLVVEADVLYEFGRENNVWYLHIGLSKTFSGISMHKLVNGSRCCSIK